MVDRYTNVINVKGQTYKFHDTVDTTKLAKAEQTLNQPIQGLFGSRLFGKIADEDEKFFRKIVNAIIRARNSNNSTINHEIVVKLSDRNIKLKPLLYKH